MNRLSEMFKGLLIIAIIGILGTLGFGSYFIFSAKEIESDKLLVPEIRLEVRGNKIDTVYVYREK